MILTLYHKALQTNLNLTAQVEIFCTTKYLQLLVDCDILNIRKAPIPKWMLLARSKRPHGHRLSCGSDRIGIFMFTYLFLLSRKVSNVTIKLPKEINNPIIPINIKIISAAVMNITSLLCISASRFLKAGRLPPCQGYFSIIEILS